MYLRYRLVLTFPNILPDFGYVGIFSDFGKT
jgi:hypothetical protein